MRSIATLLVLILFVGNVASTLAAETEPAFLAGAAKVVITPREPMYLAGFGDRVVPAEGTALDLQAKSLAIVERATNTRLVLVTLDLVEVPIQLRELLEQHLADKHQLPPASLLMNCSHTHCGPELRFAERDLATLAPARAAMCRRYNQFLTDSLKKLIDDALVNAAPAKLSYGHARCGFAMNRRLRNDAGGEPYLNRPNPDGVVDHDVPVLKVESATGKLNAVLFGYACHNTTLNLKQFHADYAGYAQQALEAAHPDSVALFMMGCGGDQNGYPRMKIPYSEQHGRSLATAVEAALEAKSRPLTGPLKLAYGTVPLDLQPAPSAERLKARLATGAEYPANGRAYFEDWDRRRLAELERGTLLRQYPFPAQVIRFGDELTFIALAGETVVDYSLRLKRELHGSAAVWIAGYSNDVFAYVPSKRVLLEGGYEAERSMMYMTHPVMPGPFEPTVEEKVIGKVRELLAATASTKNDTPDQSSTLVPQLTRAEALDGWIALFDGHTTFGFRDARVINQGTTPVLRGGSTTTEFADFSVRIKATSGGSITLGDKSEVIQPGWNALESRGSRTTIKLGSDVAVEAILLKPLASKALFNGKNLAGWDLRAPGHSTSKRPPEWTVENGVIRVRGGPGAIEYAPRDGQNLFGDMVVQIVARTRVDDCNGGFFFRNEPGKTMMGYEAQLHHKWYDPASGAHGYTTGGIDDRQQARRAVALDHEPFIMTVVAHGPHLATWVNGYQVTDWVDTRTPHANPRNGLRLEPGTLQLQAHDPETDLEFHQIRVQELTPVSRK